MKVFCGEFEVYESGILSSPDLSDTKFVISETPPMEIVFRITMDEGESGISLDVLGDSTLAMIFNKPSGIGYGPAKPVKVGNLNDRALYVSFRVSMRGNNTSYGLEYTFYLKESE